MKNIVILFLFSSLTTIWYLIYVDKQNQKKINDLIVQREDMLSKINSCIYSVSEYQDSYFIFLKKYPDAAEKFSEIMDSVNCYK